MQGEWHFQLQRQLSRATREELSASEALAQIDAVIDRELAKTKRDVKRMYLMQQRISWRCVVASGRQLSKRETRELADQLFDRMIGRSAFGEYFDLTLALTLYRRLDDKAMVAWCKKGLRGLPESHESMLGAVKKWVGELEETGFEVGFR